MAETCWVNLLSVIETTELKIWLEKTVDACANEGGAIFLGELILYYRTYNVLQDPARGCEVKFPRRENFVVWISSSNSDPFPTVIERKG